MCLYVTVHYQLTTGTIVGDTEAFVGGPMGAHLTLTVLPTVAASCCTMLHHNNELSHQSQDEVFNMKFRKQELNYTVITVF